MRLLLDSHALVWTWFQPELLSARARAAIAGVANELVVSTVTAHELLIKQHRDPTLKHLPVDFEGAVIDNRMEWLVMTPDDAIRAARLPRHHGDPWDRILIAQAQAIGATLITQDRLISNYEAPVLW